MTHTDSENYGTIDPEAVYDEKLDVKTAQAVIRQAEQAQQREFAAAYEDLCREHGYRLAAVPYIEDGRIMARLVVARRE